MRNDENGSAIILTIFAAVLCLGVVIAGADATSLYIERKRLFSVADGMALAAADNFDFSNIPSDDTGPHFRLTNNGVFQAAQSFYRSTHRFGQTVIRIVNAKTPDGKTAVIEVESNWQPPVVSVFFPKGIPLRVTSQARAEFSDGLSHR